MRDVQVSPYSFEPAGEAGIGQVQGGVLFFGCRVKVKEMQEMYWKTCKRHLEGNQVQNPRLLLSIALLMR